MGCHRASCILCETGDFTRDEALLYYFQTLSYKDSAKLRIFLLTLRLKIKEVIKMPQQIKVQCPKCGNISYLTSKGGQDEVIEFICPNCGKHELLVAYDLNLGHTDGKRK